MADTLHDAIEGYLEAQLYLDRQSKTGEKRKAMELKVQAARQHLDEKIREVINVQAQADGAAGARTRLFRRIIVAYDDSAQARWALDLGVRLAREGDVELTVLHVMTPPAVLSDEYVSTPDRVWARVVEEGNRVLNQASARMPADVPWARKTRIGDAAMEIVRSATETGADLIIIGTHARGRIAEFLLGSTAHTVIQRAACPVLAVAHDPAASPQPVAPQHVAGDEPMSPAIASA